MGNFALDLPDADVLIQVSGKYGSRQEEAQRLGRVLRPKPDGRSAQVYTLVSSRTCEEEFAPHRQLFLTEQGDRYSKLQSGRVTLSCRTACGEGVPYTLYLEPFDPAPYRIQLWEDADVA